ncbi:MULTISPECIES: YtxH domain-containing protein [unclassified Paenibacillus]|uniref:YtxH domain-containing protein n=1 Tax=Paenibacillus provencensis TaxID=441151 RepID=A0ABW3PR60_9BACL|nr:MULTISPECIES: YtxH domain-containing protein [unclassified Paenibacillus]MCM3127248.1 YtxH domain-containing protein [Paenibacillus sp. MER 78]SFS45436.1 Gas vesicle protein [Paenibacillus sp. 453mf]
MKDTNKSLLWGTLLGTIAGSITALLFAPKSGAELREDIAENAKLVTEKGQNLIEKVSEQSVKIASKVKESTEGLLQEIRGNSSEIEIATVSGISKPAKAEQAAEDIAENDTI